MALHGLTDAMISVDDGALNRTVREYTREAGVRSLEQQVGTLCRKAARLYVDEGKKVVIKSDNLPKVLGIPKYIHTRPEENGIGVATGLAWTEAGGEVLTIEVSRFKGKGLLTMTALPQWWSRL